MSDEYVKPSVVAFATEILDMQYEIDSLRREVAELKKYKEDYFELLNSSIQHNQAMMGNILVAALNGAFAGDDSHQPASSNAEG